MYIRREHIDFFRTCVIGKIWKRQFIILEILNDLKNLWLRLYASFDRCVLAHFRCAHQVLMEFVRYWILFGFWTDFTRWIDDNILKSIRTRLRRIFNAFVYVVGCYWLEPLAKQIGRSTSLYKKLYIF